MIDFFHVFLKMDSFASSKPEKSPQMGQTGQSGLKIRTLGLILIMISNHQIQTTNCLGASEQNFNLSWNNCEKHLHSAFWPWYGRMPN